MDVEIDMRAVFAVMKIRPEKKKKKVLSPVRDLNSVLLRYRCSALLTELTSQLGAGYYAGF